MVPRRNTGISWISEDDDREQEIHSSAPSPPPKYAALITKTVSRQWQQLLGFLTRTRVRGNVQPQIGQMCIIMKGRAGHDEGQMGVVTNTSRVMVEVSLLHPKGKGIMTKTKQPSSLVLLEPGLVMVQDKNGSVWIRTAPGAVASMP
jgi:hypothetical protein